jgi:hypothetical protein
MAQRPRPPSPQITWREAKSARRRPPLLRSRPGSPERPRRTTGAVRRRRPRPVRTTYVSQCFSGHFHIDQVVTLPPRSFPVVSRPTRGLPVDGRVRNAFLNIFISTRLSRCHVAAAIVSGRLPSDARSSGRRPRSQCFSEHFRGCDATTGWPAAIRRGHLPSDPARSSGRRPHSQRSSEQFNVRHDYPRASIPVVSRQTRGRPVDGRSRRALPIILTYDTTRLPRTSEFPVAGRPTRGLPVDYRHRHAFPDISVYDTPGVRRRAYTCVGEKAKTGRSVAVPRGLLEPFCEARGFFGRPTTRPPSPLQYRIASISRAFLAAM